MAITYNQKNDKRNQNQSDNKYKTQSSSYNMITKHVKHMQVQLGETKKITNTDIILTTTHENSIKLDATNAYYYCMKGKALLATGKSEDAINCLNQAIKLNPNDDAFYFYRGKAYKTKQQWYLAEKDFQTAFDMKPDDNEYKLYLDDIKTKN